MKSYNFKISAMSISLVSILALSIISVGFLLPEVIALHGEDPGVTKSLMAGSNIVSFRDSTNMLLGSSTVSVDSSTIKAGFFTIIVEEEDSNLDSTAIDVILSSATSTSSQLEMPPGIATTEMSETGPDTGVFSGTINVKRGVTTEGNTLNLGLGDAVTVLYFPEPTSPDSMIIEPAPSEEIPNGLGRLTAEISGGTVAGTVTMTDFIIDTDTESNRVCPSLLVTHPVDLQISDSDANLITVTISYANAVLDGEDPNNLQVVHRPTFPPFPPQPGIGFQWFLGGTIDRETQTITSVLQPTDPASHILGFPSPTGISGQYALGVNAGCAGGGGGGLVRPGLVVNALAGSGSLLGFFGGGSGGGAHPTFGDASLIVLESIGEGFGGTISEGDDISLDSTKVVNTGDTVVMRFNLSENQGINNLERFRMFLNFEGENYDASIIDTHITYERGGVITIVDPHEKIENVKIEIFEVNPWNLIVNVQIIFKNPFNSSILVDSWDLDRNSGKKLFPDVLQVVEPSVLLADAQIEFETSESILTTTEDMTETQLTEIPVWVKSNALWWKQKQIDDSDFMAGIKYLVQKTIIEIDENELSTSATSSEIPVWIRDIAGMWADYSITDEEFVNAMKWLLSNGILEVQQ